MAGRTSHRKVTVMASVHSVSRPWAAARFTQSKCGGQGPGTRVALGVIDCVEGMVEDVRVKLLEGKDQRGPRKDGLCWGKQWFSSFFFVWGEDGFSLVCWSFCGVC